MQAQIIFLYRENKNACDNQNVYKQVQSNLKENGSHWSHSWSCNGPFCNLSPRSICLENHRPRQAKTIQAGIKTRQDDFKIIIECSRRRNPNGSNAINANDSTTPATNQ